MVIKAIIFRLEKKKKEKQVNGEVGGGGGGAYIHKCFSRNNF